MSEVELQSPGSGKENEVDSVAGAEKAEYPVEVSTSDGGHCGWLCCLPPQLQFFNSPRWFLAFLCLFVLFQSTINNGLNGVVIPTIEKRFRLTSQRSGLIPSSYDISIAILVLPVSYFGERAHKPRWVGVGCLILGLGSLVFALPQFITGNYQPGNVQRLEYCGEAVNHTTYLGSCDKENPSIYGLLILGQLLVGVGATPLYTVGVAFLDEIASPKYVHFYLGIFYVFAALGSAVGFLMGSQFLRLYGDPGVTSHPDPEDPNFVGRWWAGYLVCGFGAVAISIPLMMYPRQIPNTAWIMEEKRLKQLGTGRSVRTGDPAFAKAGSGRSRSGVLSSLKSSVLEFVKIVKVVVALLLTPVLLLNSFGGTTEGFAIAGLIPFITKYFETQFGVTSSSAALLTGAASFFGVLGGILFSSWLMKRRNVRGPRLAKYTAAIAFIALFFIPAFLVRCSKTEIVGVTRPYPGSSVIGSNRCRTNLTSACFAACDCVSQRYDPVCGSDGYTYPTPCLAGCRDFMNGSKSAEMDDRIYTDCSCVAAHLGNVSSGQANATATVGVCSQSCSLLPLFEVLLICMLFFTFMNNVPAIQVILQSVPADRRTIATGVQWVVIRLLATIPGPLFYGFLLDKGCRLWQLTCCEEGNCWEYDAAHMSLALFGSTMACKLLSFIAFFLSWRFYASAEKKKRLEKEKKESAADVYY